MPSVPRLRGRSLELFAFKPREICRAKRAARVLISGMSEIDTWSWRVGRPWPPGRSRR
jgi:hypothetical protein